jgi:uncharacterized RDD family membrane protein YckC
MKYHIARGAEQLGTFNDLDVSSGMREGRFLPTDLCWTDGMPEWQPLETRMKALAEASGLEAPESSAITALREEVRLDQEQRRELASRGRRLAARLIDWSLMLVPLITLLLALMDASFEAEIQSLQGNPTALMEALQRQIGKAQQAGNPTVMAMSWLVVALLLGNVILLTLRGQSLGKMLAGIQIVRASDGGRAGFVKTVLLRWFLFAVIESVQIIGPVLTLANIFMIFRRDRRCLHDLVADTRVIRSVL